MYQTLKNPVPNDCENLNQIEIKPTLKTKEQYE